MRSASPAVEVVHDHGPHGLPHRDGSRRGGPYGAPARVVPAGGDAKGELELLEAATGDVQKLGKEDVRGVPTTRYRGTVEPSEHAERLREEGQEDWAAFIEKDAKPLTVEAWIDADDLVRRMRLVQSQPQEGGEGSTVDMRMDFFDFGAVPEIDVPAQSEVFDATPQLRAELEQPTDD